MLIRKDPVFGVALVAAPLFWTGLLLWMGTSVNLAWPLHTPGNFLMQVLFFPVLEEFAFRGFVQTTLAKTAWGKKTKFGFSAANAFTSVVFVLFHLLSHSPLWAGLTFFPSLIFGFFRDRYDRVMPAIVLHVFYNAGYFWLFGAPIS